MIRKANMGPVGCVVNSATAPTPTAKTSPVAADSRRATVRREAQSSAAPAYATPLGLAMAVL